MEKIDHLIHAKWIITCKKENRVLENYALAIKDKKIIAILSSKEAQQKYQAEKRTTLYFTCSHARFINSHTHLAMNLFRGLADDLELMDWLNNHIWPAEGKWVSHELVYDGSLFGNGRNDTLRNDLL